MFLSSQNEQHKRVETIFNKGGGQKYSRYNSKYFHEIYDEERDRGGVQLPIYSKLEFLTFIFVEKLYFI